MKGTRAHVVALISGGLDSAVLLADLLHKGHPVTALSCDYGARHNRRELTCAASLCRAAGVTRHVAKLDFMGRLFRSSLLKGGGDLPSGRYDAATMRQTVVPFRNGVMLAVAAGLAESIGARGVAIAAHGGDHAIYPDCRDSFLRRMGEAMRLGTYARIKLHYPYVSRSKADLVKLGARLGVDFAATWSCYAGRRLHCGVCGTCRERRAAFRRAGLPDPTIYLDG